MATQKQRETARKNVKQAQAGARKKRTISKLSKQTRTDLGREGAKAAARKRGATKGTGTGAGAMTVTELRREAAELGIEGRSKMGKAQLIRAVGHARNEFIGIEHLSETELSRICAVLEKEAGEEPTRHAAIVRLIERR